MTRFPEWWYLLCRWQFALLLVVYTYMGLTTSSGPHIPQYDDKMMHYLGYLVAGLSITGAFPGWPWWQRALVLLAYSGLIEVLQHFLPPRTLSLGDMVANALGVGSGLLLIEAFRKTFPRWSHFLFRG
ncbi:VanZ family protein [Marinimicrobium locisalis]|uniref:VanZ family protein n=1 Tax=Marinimicrobium locisalis TaxID=546022 RepID=UPI0032217DF8